MSNFDLVSKVQAQFVKPNMPDYRTGMEVEVYQIINE
jgi:hypothetical protein